MLRVTLKNVQAEDQRQNASFMIHSRFSRHFEIFISFLHRQLSNKMHRFNFKTVKHLHHNVFENTCFHGENNGKHWNWCSQHVGGPMVGDETTTTAEEKALSLI